MLRADNLRVSFNGQPVLRDVDLEIASGEILCLLGASGSGKTTLLRVIAGLQTADSGDVVLNQHSIVHMPVHARGFGLMFQDFALFPHLNVAQNVVFGLQMARLPAIQQQARLREVLVLVGLSGYEKRDITSLSGGEKQRVALARSLAPNPRLLMLDEPLGALDAALRDRLVVELRTIIKQIGLTAVYVTHDQAEAFAIADRIALLHEGQIEQIDTPEMLYRRPRTVYTAQFFGLTNILPILNQANGQAQTAVGTIAVDGQPNALLLHPDGLRLASADASNVITGQVVERVFQGDNYRLRVKIADDHVLTFIHAARDGAVPEIDAKVGIVVDKTWISSLQV